MESKELQSQEHLSIDAINETHNIPVDDVQIDGVQQKETNKVQNKTSDHNRTQFVEPSILSSSVSMPQPDDIGTSHPNITTHHKQSSSTNISIGSISTTKSDDINRSRQNMDDNDQERPPIKNNLSRISSGNYTPSAFNPEIDKINELEYIQSTGDDGMDRSSVVKDDIDEIDSSSSYLERNKHQQQGDDVEKAKALKIQIVTTIDRHTPTTITQATLTRDEEKITEAKVTDNPVDSVIRASIKRDQTCSFGKFECIMSVILLSGLGCIVFGIYELSIDPSSIAGWLFLSIPTISFIVFLVVRYCLKKQKDIQSEVDDRSPASNYPIAPSQETNNIEKKVIQSL